MIVIKNVVHNLDGSIYFNDQIFKKEYAGGGHQTLVILHAKWTHFRPSFMEGTQILLMNTCIHIIKFYCQKMYTFYLNNLLQLSS